MQVEDVKITVQVLKEHIMEVNALIDNAKKANEADDADVLNNEVNACDRMIKYLEKTFIETIPDKYFTWEIDVDGSFYQKMKRDVESFSKNINESIWKVFNDYEKKAAEHSYYYLGYNICFTYDNKKYYQDFNFKDEELEDELLDDLNKLNCCDIYVKPGHLD